MSRNVLRLIKLDIILMTKKNLKSGDWSPNQNHPAKGSTTKVAPIRDLKAIRRIKKLLEDQPRNLCLFTLGINTAYRANELLSIKVKQVDHLEVGDLIELKQSKVNKYRAIKVNATVLAAIDKWLAVHPNPVPDAPLFPSRKAKNEALNVSVVSRMVKEWCQNVGLPENYASHTMRKTWGYHQRVKMGQPTALLMAAYGHSTEAQTLEYLGIQSEEISGLYDMEL